MNNLLLTLFAFVVLVGTIYPMVLEAFTGDRVSVGAPWFDRSAIPIALVLLLAMGIGPMTPYRVARPAVLWRRVRLPLQVAAATAAVVVVAGLRPITVVATVALAAFVVSGILRHAHEVIRSRPGRYLGELARLPGSEPGYWGGMIAHVGVALVAVAIAFSGSFGVRQEITLAVGESAPFEGYTLTYRSPFLRQEPNRTVIGRASSCGAATGCSAPSSPRLNQYPNQVQAIPTPSVRTGLGEDVYLSLVRIGQGDATVTVDAFRFPLMWLLWLGGLIVFAGGIRSYVGRRKSSNLPVLEAAGV